MKRNNTVEKLEGIANRYASEIEAIRTSFVEEVNALKAQAEDLVKEKLRTRAKK